MSSFAGISMVTSDKVRSMPVIEADTDSGYHLFVVNNYSRTVQEKPTGQVIISAIFMVGGCKWCICYYPNGDHSGCADFISFCIIRADDDDDMEEAVEVKFQFSFIDQVEYQKQMHIRATKTYSFSRQHPVHGCPEFMKRDALERSAHLKGDCFTIRCDIMVCKDLNTGTLSDMHENFDHLLQNKLGADVTFEVSGAMFSAHRCVLAARSKVFTAQLFGPMMEGTTSRVIQIKDMEAEVFAAMLRFIYTDILPQMDKDISMEEKGQDEEEGQLKDVMWLQDLLVAADRYDLQRLKFLCEEKLSEHIGVSSVASTLALAEHYHFHKLKEVCFRFIQVQSPECLDKVMATDGWFHMISTYPSVLNEFVGKLVSNQKDTKRKK